VGSVGRQHARQYRELPNVELVGVSDPDRDLAETVATDHNTVACSRNELFASADAISVAVPPGYGVDPARAAIDCGVAVLVAEPFDPGSEQVPDLVRQARERGVTLQFGNPDRFNPAFRTLADLVGELDVLALTTRRLAPAPAGETEPDVVRDLLVRDIETVLALVDRPVEAVSASTGAGGRYVTATLGFEGGPVAGLTGSRVAQRPAHELSVTATDCRIDLDYRAQSVAVHRQSYPDPAAEDGGEYPNERITEHPQVERVDPLRAELAAFAGAVGSGGPPAVDTSEGLRALEIAHRISRATVDQPVSEIRSS
jgi:predicted dehydrogenase